MDGERRVVSLCWLLHCWTKKEELFPWMEKDELFPYAGYYTAGLRKRSCSLGWRKTSCFLTLATRLQDGERGVVPLDGERRVVSLCWLLHCWTKKEELFPWMEKDELFPYAGYYTAGLRKRSCSLGWRKTSCFYTGY